MTAANVAAGGAVAPVVIAGGGTGGHLYPGLALAEVLVPAGLPVTFVGTAGGIEARVVPGTGLPFRVLAGRQLRGGGAARAVTGLAVLARSVVRGRSLLRELEPDLVVGVGGYASVATVLAARLSRIPTLLLEQNAIPGAANRLLARVADRICVGFAESVPLLPGARAVHTGNPVRASVLRATRTLRERPGLLAFGGSAGARRLNQAMVEAVRILASDLQGVEVTHQTGTADAEGVRASYAAMRATVRVEPFIADMGTAYAAADVVVARAGAMTCAELTALGLPAVLVPYPHAADDHQRRNAEILVAAGAAEMVLDRELDGARLAQALRSLIGNPGRRATMAARARAWGRPDAAERVAEECRRLLASRAR